MRELSSALLLLLGFCDGRSANAGIRKGTGPVVPSLICLGSRRNCFLLSFNWRELDDVKVPGCRKATRKRFAPLAGKPKHTDAKATGGAETKPNTSGRVPPTPLLSFG